MEMSERWLSAFLGALPAGIRASKREQAGEQWNRALESVEWRNDDNVERFLRRVTARAMEGFAHLRSENKSTENPASDHPRNAQVHAQERCLPCLQE